METARMAELLAPFTGGETLAPRLLEALQRYLDLLLRWNARVNLTAVRDAETIVSRHFGESLFAARALLRGGREAAAPATLADVGSGAGFPGIPMKLFAPEIELTLIESHNKKAVFLREVVRSLGLDRAQVFCGRAEHWAKTADLVTLRAVEQFERALPVAANLVAEDCRLGLLVGAGQVPTAQEVLGGNWEWEEPVGVPRSEAKVVIAARRRG
ncbi:MAG TPA: 16S rRNA (guanine(527)-N(7))-methyltransferase RsmG [Candidatus Limnocylindrales bacterium]|nr:16S rRNA (guanine(527)-N(7))-methyltransferase RsmG [Candidatus Limnocylindrales bacterium]